MATHSSHGRRSLVGYSPRGHKQLDTTERLHFAFIMRIIYQEGGGKRSIQNSNSSLILWNNRVLAWSETWV